MTMQTDETDVAERTSDLVEYSATEAGLAELRGRLQGVAYDLTTVKGNAAARADRKELVSLRTSLDKRRLELNADDQARIAARNKRAKELTGEILALEAPVDEQIRVDEARRETERKVKAEAEARAEERRQGVLDAIRGYLVRASHKGAVVIASLIEQLVGISDADLQLVEGATALRNRVLEQLRTMHAESLAAEAEARRLRADREAFEIERKATAAAEAERRAADEKRQTEARAEADRESAVQQAELDRQRAEIEAERTRLAEEQAERQRQAELERMVEEGRRQAELAEREAAERLERDWLDAMAEDQRRIENAARQAAAADEQARQVAHERAEVDAVDLVIDLAGMQKQPTATVWREVKARAWRIADALRPVVENRLEGDV